MDCLDLLKETEQKKLLINFSLLTNSSILLLDKKKKIIFNIDSKNKNNKIDLGNKPLSLPKDPKDYQKLLINLYEQKTSLSYSLSDKYSLRGEPLILNNTLYGALLFSYPTISFSLFYKQLELLMQFLKSLLSLHYELDNLSEEIVYNYEEFSLISEISQLLGGILKQSEICRIGIEKISNIIPIKKISILLKENKDDHFRIVASQGLTMKNKNLIPEKINSNQGICGWITEKGQSILVNNQEQFYLPLNFKKTECQDCQLCHLPFIFVPLKSENKVIGLLNISGTSKGQDLTSSNLKLIELITNQLSLALGNARLFQEREETLLEVVGSLVAAIDAKDPYSSGHSKRVYYYTKNFCEELNISEKLKKEISFSALLHDIGKIGIPENILFKPGKLTSEEWEKIENHPKNGAEIIKHITRFRTLVDGIRNHHERFDGKGYPDGLKGERNPLAGRIICLADTFDALTTDRPYRKGFSTAQALSIMEENKGTQFDPHLLDIFLGCFKKGKLKLKKD